MFKNLDINARINIRVFINTIEVDFLFGIQLKLIALISFSIKDVLEI